MVPSGRPLDEATPLSFLHRPLPAGLEGIADLALDLRWFGSPWSDRLWEMLDADTWDATNNPYMILQDVSQSRLEAAAADPAFGDELRRCLEIRARSLDSPGWFQGRYPDSDLRAVAYFSMEFGLCEALPIYSGGLGILAGDHLKTASDLGVPLTGVGLLYQEGYFRQILDQNGWQVEAFPYNDPTVLPVLPVQNADGSWLRIPLQLPGRELLLRVWQARVGRARLYLLDSNDLLNSPWDRGITAALYAPGQERRLIQEVVLGVGGWRVLEALGIDPEVCHLNEGHAAFAVLERAASFMRKTGCPFPVALQATRAGNVFTTHTAVPAGIDRFDRSLVQKYADAFAARVGISVDQLLDLGRQAPGSPDGLLNIAYLAMRGSGSINGVSRLHADVSRRIFGGLYLRWPQVEVPIGWVTNGVHRPSWDSALSRRLWAETDAECEGVEPDPAPDAAGLPASVDDARLWGYRNEARRSLVEYIRRRLVRQLHQHGAPSDAVHRASDSLSADALTLGFARRFAAYKRPTLLLHDPDRLARLLCDPARPVQLIVAGKAHPADEDGKRLVQAVAQFASRPDLCHRTVFLEDYDIALMQELAAGVDVWINTPRRPWEACGTSGMKLLVNGGLNLSELDGWWAEAYTPEVGWALGDGQEHDDPGWDAHEAQQLYETLEGAVIPEFYGRNGEGIPERWIARVRASMSQLTPRFTSSRMLQEYVERSYLPAARAYRRREADGARLASALEEWSRRIAAHWHEMRFGDVRLERRGDLWHFDAGVHLGDMNPAWVRVELYADPQDGGSPVRAAMERQGSGGSEDEIRYAADVPASRPAEHYTPRIVPYHPDALIPLEDAHILWQR